MCVCVCVCYCPPVCEYCPNYEVVVLQSQTLTTSDIVSVAHFCIAYLLKFSCPLLLSSNIRPGEAAHFLTAASAINVSPHGIIYPPGFHPSPSQYTKKLFPPPPYLSLPYLCYFSLISPLPHLPNCGHLISLSAAEISFSMAFSCCSSVATTAPRDPPLMACLLCAFLEDRP